MKIPWNIPEMAHHRAHSCWTSITWPYRAAMLVQTPLHPCIHGSHDVGMLVPLFTCHDHSLHKFSHMTKMYNPLYTYYLIQVCALGSGTAPTTLVTLSKDGSQNTSAMDAIKSAYCNVAYKSRCLRPYKPGLLFKSCFYANIIHLHCAVHAATHVLCK